MTVAKKYNIRTKLSVDRQEFYDNMSEVLLTKYFRFAKHGECEKIVGRFIVNLYNKKFQDRPYIELNK